MNSEIIKKTTALGELIIKPVDKNTAKEMIINNHYSHKWNVGFGVLNYGIFYASNPDECLGVACYGYMKNLKAKIFSHHNPNAWMCELNRLWISDILGKNAETILIGASIRLLRKADPNIVAIQSFADGRLGCGTIYKAANFKYYGFHYNKFLENTKTGEITHEQNLRANIAYLVGDFKIFEVKTHRYIYPLCKGFKFVRPEKKYPEYDKGQTSVTWDRDRSKIVYNITQLMNKLI
jgi:hypothetical protein